MQAKRLGQLLRGLSLLAACAASCALPNAAWSQTPGNATAPPAGEQPDFTKEQLDQMLAPIALYPDSLLSQVLMASTYPVEVVEADRWAKENASLKGDALATALEKQTWDPSVKSLVNFPPVLAMMSENLSTTVKIGDAFIGQQKEVMDSVQGLRAKAQQTGNLKSTEEQKVSTQTESGTQVIVIESASPEVIYVPQYNPTVVYGTWPYPAYPPYPYYPPGYVASNVVSFGLGVACGVAWGYAWGNCNWGHGNIDIDVNRNTNINRNINRENYRQSNRGTFQHDPAHRQGAAYRNTAAADRVGARSTNRQATEARNEFRGKAEAGRSDLARGGAESFRGGDRPGAADRAGDRAGSGDRGGTKLDGGRSGGLDSSRGGPATREASNRGNSSRSSASGSRAQPAQRASPSRSGGGGGASRGGGGARGGGGGGRGGGGRR